MQSKYISCLRRVEQQLVDDDGLNGEGQGTQPHLLKVEHPAASVTGGAAVAGFLRAANSMTLWTAGVSKLQAGDERNADPQSSVQGVEVYRPCSGETIE